MVKIGVCGHRNIINLRTLSNRIDEVLKGIVAHFGSRSIDIISSLAEGADRLVVERALKLFSANLIVPLPLEKSEYLLDFITDESKDEFNKLLALAKQVYELPQEETREASYLAAGEYILKNSDILIALWDGEASKGIGGTADIVKIARSKNVPIAWIYVLRGSEDRSLNSSKSVNDERIIYERFPNQPKDKPGEL